MQSNRTRIPTVSPSALLEKYVNEINFKDVENWLLESGNFVIPDLDIFSYKINKLHEYQKIAIENAVKALYCYCGKGLMEWKEGESDHDNTKRKVEFLELYPENTFNQFDLLKSSKVFDICNNHFNTNDDRIPYFNFINRMCFWMTTGSGKTLVIIKIMEYLCAMQKAGKIPQHGYNRLVLAPTKHAINQIKKTVKEFNSYGGIQFELVDLRLCGSDKEQLSYNDTFRIYYCRSDHLSDITAKQIIDWKRYENGGKWFVFLDEAHKGNSDDSKRKAYYSLLARHGFLFNFSATFVEKDDILTTVSRYNLPDFVSAGRGKRILLAGSGFGERATDFLPDNSKNANNHKDYVVLESLLALASARACAKSIRNNSDLSNLYHMPLMLTLVNSVNTTENDLLVFFKILRNIASGDLSDDMFNQAKKSLESEWNNGHRFFEHDKNRRNKHICLQDMGIEEFRQNIFGNTRHGPLEYMEDNEKQIAFKLKTADAPFGLIKIGDIEKWTKNFLSDMEYTKTQNKDWFSNLENESNFSVLMGSRAFFESWDTARPNIINFINIGKRVGKQHAKIFVAQSIGRGVRVAPLYGQRIRLEMFLKSSNANEEQKAKLSNIKDKVEPLETLMIYATNQNSVDLVMNGVTEIEAQTPFMPLGDVFKKNKKPETNNIKFPLLVPDYESVDSEIPPFIATQKAIGELKEYLKCVPDSVLIVANGMTAPAISNMRTVANDKLNRDVVGYADDIDKDYNMAQMRNMFIRRVAQSTQKAKGVRESNDGDIVHFKHMHAALSSGEINKLRAHIIKLIEKRDSKIERENELERKIKNNLLSREEIYTETKKEFQSKDTFDEKFISKDGKSLNMRYCAKHYYTPMITSNERAHFIRFAIDVESEIKFLKQLEEYLKDENNSREWDSWMFCKLNENHDKVYIPYQDNNVHAYFYPDFIFWMQKDNEYRIVFVDPKGTAHSGYIAKAAGYSRVFMKGKNERIFNYALRKNYNLKVSVKLLFYAAEIPSDDGYNFWTQTVDDIFRR